MSKFATGKNSYGISDRSGFRYRLRDMKKEWNGLLVGSDEFEEKHPQLEPMKKRPDREALRNPRPESNLSEQRMVQWGWDPVGFKEITNVTPTNNLAPTASVGEVTVTS